MQKIKKLLKKISKKHLIIGLISLFLIIFIIFLVLWLTKDYKITSSNLEGYKNYYSKSHKLSFDFPEEYKVKKVDDIFYIAKKFKKNEAIKPYFTVAVEEDYNDAKTYLEAATQKSKEEYGNTFTPITEMLVLLIKDKYTSKLMYNNFYKDELIVENRYAFVLNNQVYAISSFELKTNSEDINQISNNIISSLKLVEE